MQSFDLYGSLDWADDAAIVRQRLGSRADPAIAALRDIKLRLQAAEIDEAAALKRLVATRPRTEASKAAYRTSIERYSRRPTVDPVEAERALLRLDGAQVAA